MKKIISLLLITVSFLFVGCSDKNDETKNVLKVGMELAYPPFEMSDKGDLSKNKNLSNKTYIKQFCLLFDYRATFLNIFCNYITSKRNYGGMSNNSIFKNR